MKAEGAFDAMEGMGFQAAAIGEKEFTHGLAFFRERIRAHPRLFVSANLIDAATEKPLAQPFVIRTLPRNPIGKYSKPTRVAILGLFGPAHLDELRGYLGADADKIRVLDPIVTAREWIPKLRQKADYVIVAAHVETPAAEEIAKAVDGIDMIVVGHANGIYLGEAPKVNGTTLLANGDRSRYGATARVTTVAPGLRGVDLQMTPLSDVYTDNAVMAKLRDAYKTRLAEVGGGSVTEHETTPVAAFFAPAGRNHYAGSAACALCHSDAAEIWRNSRHANALKTLESSKEGINSKRPDCVRCHTVGLGQATGFRITSPNGNLSGVGCESCHGPGSEHIERASAGEAHPGSIVRKVAIGNPALCLRCHDPINDPKFDYVKAIEAIRHWKA